MGIFTVLSNCSKLVVATVIGQDKSHKPTRDQRVQFFFPYVVGGGRGNNGHVEKLTVSTDRKMSTKLAKFYSLEAVMSKEVETKALVHCWLERRCIQCFRKQANMTQ